MQVSTKTMRRWIDNGNVKAYRVGHTHGPRRPRITTQTGAETTVTQPNPPNEVGPTNTSHRQEAGTAESNGDDGGSDDKLDELIQAAAAVIQTAAAERAAKLRDYLQVTIGDTHGYLIVAYTADPYLDSGGGLKHRQRREHAYPWPADADAVQRDILDAWKSDVFICPYVMPTRKRAKGEAVARDKIHADIDDMIDAEKVRNVGGYAASTGTPGHAHVYVPLAEPVTSPQHEALCRGLGKYLGGADAKISDNDLLRPVGARNFKRTLPGSPDFIPNFKMDPAEVEWLVPPTERVPRTPDDLARQLNVRLPADDEVNGSPRTATTSTRGESVDLTGHPDVRKALDTVSGDRSDDTYRVVAACYDDRLTLEQTRWAVAQRADLAQAAGRAQRRRRADLLAQGDQQPAAAGTDHRASQRRRQTPVRQSAFSRRPIAGHQAALDVFKEMAAHQRHRPRARRRRRHHRQPAPTATRSGSSSSDHPPAAKPRSSSPV